MEKGEMMDNVEHVDALTYTMYGGRRGMGRMFFLQHLLAKRTAQLMAANSRIAELERQLLRYEIRLAHDDHIWRSKFSELLFRKGMHINTKEEWI